MVESDKLDLYHSFHSYLPIFVPEGPKVVVTIHDLFALNDPGFFSKYGPLACIARLHFRKLIQRSVRRADAITTVSEYCRKEIVSSFSGVGDKVRVIYNASGLAKNGTGGSGLTKIVDKEYLLYVGNCRSYKNIDVLIDGYHRFLQSQNRTTALGLVIAGNDSYHVVKAKARRVGIDQHLTFLRNPRDEEIESLYANAQAFVMPSKFEGFGIPVIEAMSFGVPVICSDADALVEIAGGAALIFRKNRSDDLASAIDRVVNDRNLRGDLAANGARRAKEFTWELSGRKLLELYGNVLHEDLRK
jgi:glycosyltransferase involved in cell wall biosynthesis